MTVTLTLATATVAEDTVTVSYAPGANPVRDLAMNAAPAFTGLEVENLTADNTPPSFGFSVTLVGRTMRLRYDENLDESSVPPTTAYTLTVGGEAIEVEDVDISGQVVTVLLASAPPTGERVRVSYRVPTENQFRTPQGTEPLRGSASI